MVVDAGRECNLRLDPEAPDVRDRLYSKPPSWPARAKRAARSEIGGALEPAGWNCHPCAKLNSLCQQWARSGSFLFRSATRCEAFLHMHVSNTSAVSVLRPCRAALQDTSPAKFIQLRLEHWRAPGCDRLPVIRQVGRS